MVFPHVVEPYAKVDNVHVVCERVAAVASLEGAENTEAALVVKIVEHQQRQLVLAAQPIYQRTRCRRAQSLAGHDCQIESLGQLSSGKDRQKSFFLNEEHCLETIGGADGGIVLAWRYQCGGRAAADALKVGGMVWYMGRMSVCIGHLLLCLVHRAECVTYDRYGVTAEEA